MLPSAFGSTAIQLFVGHIKKWGGYTIVNSISEEIIFITYSVIAVHCLKPYYMTVSFHHDGKTQVVISLINYKKNWDGTKKGDVT